MLEIIRKRTTLGTTTNNISWEASWRFKRAARYSGRVLHLMLVLWMALFAPIAARAAPATSHTVSEVQVPLMQIPPSFFTVIDQHGANDEPGQVDLTQMGRDDSDASIYSIFWSWDAIDFAGQTGDACALFDYNDNGNVDVVVCGQVENGDGWTSENPEILQTTDIPNNFPEGVGASPFVFRCVDSQPDKCSQPSDPRLYTPGTDIDSGTLGDLDSSPPENLVTDTDPFGSGDGHPNDSTLQINISKVFLESLAADLGSKYPIIPNPDPILVNVCSYPSAGSGGNNNPFDCITTPRGGLPGHQEGSRHRHDDGLRVHCSSCPKRCP